MSSLIAATATSRRPGSSIFAPLLLLGWLCLLSEAASECAQYVYPGAYRPAADAQLPFNCTGYYAIDLTDRGLTSFDWNATLQFDTCSTITKLYLGCNNFVTLERGAFAGLSKLRTLYLTHSQALDTLIPGVFQGLIALRNLHIQRNPALRTVTPGVFQGLVALQQLNLKDNPSLDTLIPGVFQGLNALQWLQLQNNPSLNFERVAKALTNLSHLEAIYLWECGITAVPNGSFANLPKLEILDMTVNPSVCQVDSSTPGKVTCNCANDYFDNSQEMPGGGDGYCLCPAGQYFGRNICLQCPANTYSDVPNTSPSCTRCAPGNVSDVGSTDASQCRDDPLLQAEQEKNAAQQEKNAALQKAQLQTERANNATTANLRLEQEKTDAQKRETLITILSAAVTLLLLVVGGGVSYRFHRKNLTLTTQLNEGLLMQVAEQHEEMVYLRNWRLNERDIKLGEKVAKGSEGEVWKGELRGHGIVAIKIAIGIGSTFDAIHDPVWREAEVSAMMSMQNECLVKFLGAGVMSEPEHGLRVLFTVQEFMSGGSLDRRIWDQPLCSVTWEEKLQWCRDTAKGMAFVHRLGFAHRDLKSQNVLYDVDSGRAKVADFGMTRELEQSASNSPRASSTSEITPSSTSFSMMTSAFGTAAYMAPELCDALASPSSRLTEYGSYIDQYSYGIMMSEMVNMAPPWQGMTPEEISSAVATGERPLLTPELAASAPTGWIKLMQQCWDQDPTNRPDFDAIHDALEQICRNVEHAREFDNASATRQTSRHFARDNASNQEHENDEMEMYYLVP